MTTIFAFALGAGAGFLVGRFPAKAATTWSATVEAAKSAGAWVRGRFKRGGA